MSFYAESFESTIVIKKDRIADLVKAYNYDADKHYNADDDGLAYLLLDEGFVLEMILAWSPVTKRSVKTGDVTFYYPSNPYNNNEVESFLQIIAPFVQKGSSIAFHGEDNSMWAYYFNGESVSYHRGIVYFEGMPGQGVLIPDEPSAEDAQADDDEGKTIPLSIVEEMLV